jgi:F-type H+-transporting ATPase subunit b
MILLVFAESIKLVPDGTIVIHIAIIITMVFVLNNILFKPISRILNERENRTRGRLVESREIIQRVEDSLLRYEGTLRQARAEGYRLLEKQQADAFANKQQRIILMRKEVEEQIGEEKKAIEAQVADARLTLEGEARRVAASISSQILGR